MSSAGVTAIAGGGGINQTTSVMTPRTETVKDRERTGKCPHQARDTVKLTDARLLDD